MDEPEIAALRRRLTELREENAALRETESRYRALAEHSTAGIWQIRPSGETLFVNPAMCRMLECEGPAALDGRRAFEFFTEESLPTMRREHERRAEGVASAYEVELVGARGGHRRVLIAGAPLLSPDGKVESLIGTFTDVTQEHVAMTALRRARARLDLAQEAAEMALFEWDIAADRICSWYGGRERSAEGTLHTALAQSIAPEHRDRMKSEIERAVDDPRCERFDLEYQAVVPDGSARWRVAKCRLLRDDAGRALKLVGASVDVTDKKLLEARLAAAERLDSLGRLAGGIAHDFNNLLTIILSTVTLVQSCGVPAQEGLGDIQEAAERAARLTRRLLAFARRQPMERVPVDIGALASSSRELLQRALGEDVELALDVAPDLPPVSADPSQLEQVILNLTSNARDAMPIGGRLRIEVERVDRQVVMRFTDTGVGMDDRTRERAVEPFFSTKSSGSGLGLATTYGIVTQLGGHLAMRSQPGRGTTVEVQLPAIDAPAAPEPSAHESRGSRGEVLVVVDDEPGVRRVLARCLVAEGYTVLTAASAEEAMSLVDDGADLLVTDVRMPRVSGTELARRVRARWSAMPVLFVSGYSDDEVASEPRTAFVAKPFEPEELLAAIRRLLDGPP